jgi:hypothetical protein
MLVAILWTRLINEFVNNVFYIKYITEPFIEVALIKNTK